MNAQEQQMLQGLIDRVSTTQLPEKDSDAENLLGSTLGRNPDALYILAQTVLVQQYALEQAKRQLAEAQQQATELRTQTDQLRKQASAPQKHTSFLGSLLGRDDDAPRQPAPPPPPQALAQPQYQSVPSYPQQGYAPQQAYPPAQGGFGGGYGAPQGGGFLRSALQTATGVAAGALAFEGVESLMHGFGHAAGYGSEFAVPPGGGFGGGPREEVINNYYGDARPGDTSGGSSFLPDFNDKSGGSSWPSSDPTHEGSRDLSAAPGTADMGHDDDSGSAQDFASNTDSTGDDTSAFEDSSSSAGNQASDDSGAGFDDSGSGFDSGDDPGGGFDDSSSGGDGF